MSIRFKFRSSVNFDSVEIENRPSISAAELRAKIIRGKNSQQQQQGFDLVFSDAATGLEYKGDDSLIPSGSSVIVKRVPGATQPLVLSSIGASKGMAVKDSCTLKPFDGRKDEIKDFGVDISHVPDSELPQFDLEIDANNFIVNENEEVPGLRLECQKLDSSDISQAIPRGSNPRDNEKNFLQEAKAVEQMKLNKLSTPNFLAVQSSSLPLELKCSLCQTFFKEAVMIPCCQHSFCDKCIRLVLTEKGRCPKCFSSKCNVEDLLPNLSLRQAIEHFLESQMLDVDFDKAMQKYVPDGESGIQARDVSCAVTVQRERDMPQSSFVTGNGSNQVLMGSSYDQHHQRNFPYGSAGDRDIKSTFPSQKLKQFSGFGGGHPYHGNIQRRYENFAPPDDFQGESQPFVGPQTNMHGAGGHRNFLAHGGYKKGVRTCFVCGSPDHLMRDCPVSNQNPMYQPGNGAFHGGMPDYGPSYWNGSTMASFRPYTNMYSNAMMSYNAPYSVSPFAVSPYMPSMFGGMTGPGRNMGPHHSEYFGLQHCEKSRNHSNENHPRELSDNEDGSSENYHHSYPEKSNEYRSQKHKGPSLSHSGDSSTRISGRRSQHDKYVDSNPRYVDERHEKSSHSFAGRDKKPHAERSNSGKEEVLKSSDWHTEGRHKHHHGESKKYHEKRERCESNLSLGNRSSQKDVKRRDESDARDSHKKNHSHSDYSFEPTSPHEQRHKYKESDIGHDSRHYRQSRDRRHDDRRQVDEEVRDEHGHHKRRRVH